MYHYSLREDEEDESNDSIPSLSRKPRIRKSSNNNNGPAAVTGTSGTLSSHNKSHCNKRPVCVLKLKPSTAIEVDIKAKGYVNQNNTLLISIQSIYDREQEMRIVASNKQQTKWRGSLLFQKCQQSYVNSHAKPKITIRIPEEKITRDFLELIYPTLVRYYMDGIVYCSNEVRGPDMLQVLDFFQIIYFPNQMQFANVGVFLRMRLFCYYSLQRVQLKEFIMSCSGETAFVVASREEPYVLHSSKRMLTVLQPISIAMEVFSPNQENDEIDYSLRMDFKQYLEGVLLDYDVDFSLQTVCSNDTTLKTMPVLILSSKPQRPFDECSQDDIPDVESVSSFTDDYSVEIVPPKEQRTIRRHERIKKHSSTKLKEKINPQANDNIDLEMIPEMNKKLDLNEYVRAPTLVTQDTFSSSKDSFVFKISGFKSDDDVDEMRYKSSAQSSLYTQQTPNNAQKQSFKGEITSIATAQSRNIESSVPKKFDRDWYKNRIKWLNKAAKKNNVKGL